MRGKGCVETRSDFTTLTIRGSRFNPENVNRVLLLISDTNGKE